MKSEAERILKRLLCKNYKHKYPFDLPSLVNLACGFKTWRSVYKAVRSKSEYGLLTAGTAESKALLPASHSAKCSLTYVYASVVFRVFLYSLFLFIVMWNV